MRLTQSWRHHYLPALLQAGIAFPLMTPCFAIRSLAVLRKEL